MVVTNMTMMEGGFLPHEPQQFGRTIGECLANLVRARWPRDTAKHVARAWELDATTAANVCRGHASERTITKAIKAEGWSVLEPLGRAMTGRSYDQHLQHQIEEADRARASIESRRERVRALERQAAAMGRLPAGPGAVPPG